MLAAFQRLCFLGNGASQFFSRLHSQGPIIVLKDHSRAANVSQGHCLAPWWKWPVMSSELEDSLYCILSTNPPCFLSSKRNVLEHFYLKSLCHLIINLFQGGSERCWRLSGKRKLWANWLAIPRYPPYMRNLRVVVPWSGQWSCSGCPGGCPLVLWG